MSAAIAGAIAVPRRRTGSAMNGPKLTVSWGAGSGNFALFRTLSSEQRSKTIEAMVRRDLVRGEMLVAQGDPSDSLFMVLHGALAVHRDGNSQPFAELRAGELIGEIGFFANVPRTANVVAIRDTSVLVLTRSAYQGLARDTPAIAEALLAALALRFARRTERLPVVRTSPVARTVALVEAGSERVPAEFLSADAPSARRHRCRDRRSRARRGERFPAARLTIPRSATGSTNSNRPRRSWSISAAATLRPGPARRSARPTWWCSPAAARRRHPV